MRTVASSRWLHSKTKSIKHKVYTHSGQWLEKAGKEQGVRLKENFAFFFMLRIHSTTLEGLGVGCVQKFGKI